MPSEIEDSVEYAADIAFECGVYTEDPTCQAQAQFSTIFIMNGLLLLFVTFNMCCVCCGSCMAFMRVCGAWCGSCLFITQIIMWLTTGSLRFSRFGELCAMNWTGTNYTYGKAEDYDFDEADLRTDHMRTWTYRKDARLITTLWVIQLFCCIPMCYAATKPVRPTMTLVSQSF